MACSSTKTPSSSSFSSSHDDQMTLDEFYTIYHIECNGSSEQTEQKVFEFFNLQETEGNTLFFEKQN
jgi:hypothetical protein